METLGGRGLLHYVVAVRNRRGLNGDERTGCIHAHKDHRRDDKRNGKENTQPRKASHYLSFLHAHLFCYIKLLWNRPFKRALHLSGIESLPLPGADHAEDARSPLQAHAADRGGVEALKIENPLT